MASCGPVRLRVFGADEADAVAQALQQEFSAIVQVGGSFAAEPPRGHFAEPWEKGGLLVSVTTATAWGIPLALLFARAVVQRAGIDDEDKAADIELILQEAVSNALVHGNLGVDSIARGSAEGLRHLADTISHRLSIPAYALRRVHLAAMVAPIGIEILVGDEGAGFDPAAVCPPANGCSGRGIDLLHRLSQGVDYLDGGRTVKIRIAL